METSITRSATTPSIARSYNRIAGSTPVIKTTGGFGGSNIAGPQFKSKTESALERYAAERAVREAEQKEMEEKNPFLRMKRLQGERTFKTFEEAASNPQKALGEYEKTLTGMAGQTEGSEGTIQKNLKGYESFLKNYRGASDFGRKFNR